MGAHDDDKREPDTFFQVKISMTVMKMKVSLMGMMMMMMEAGTSVRAVARVSWRAWVRAVIRSSLDAIITNSHNFYQPSINGGGAS